MPLEPPDDASRLLSLTRFIAPVDSTLAKEFVLDESGEIVKKSHAQLSRGLAKTETLEHGLESLPGLIADLEPHECLSTGVFDVPKCRVIAQSAENPSDSSFPVRHRTKEAMRQPSLGLILLDHDPSARMPERFKCNRPSELMALLVEAIPILADAGWVGRGSSSQGVFNKKTRKPYPGVGGLHVFIASTVINLDQLKEYLEARIWLAGYGFVELARNGRRLLRTPIDLSVLSPERLIFEAAPILGPGVAKEEPQWEQQAGDLLDLASIDISDREREEAERLQQEALNERYIH